MKKIKTKIINSMASTIGRTISSPILITFPGELKSSPSVSVAKNK